MQKIFKFVASNPVFVFIGILVVFVLTKVNSLFKPKERRSVDHRMDTFGSSISNVEAKRIAGALEIAMDRPGTDEETIFSSLRGLSSKDYGKVYNEFGKIAYSTTGGASGHEWLFSAQDLNFWLTNELSLEELQRLRVINPSLPL